MLVIWSLNYFVLLKIFTVHIKWFVPVLSLSTTGSGGMSTLALLPSESVIQATIMARITIIAMIYNLELFFFGLFPPFSSTFISAIFSFFTSSKKLAMLSLLNQKLTWIWHFSCRFSGLGSRFSVLSSQLSVLRSLLFRSGVLGLAFFHLILITDHWSLLTKLQLPAQDCALPTLINRLWLQD